MASPDIHVLLDRETSRVLAMGRRADSLKHTGECTPESMVYLAVQRPNYTDHFPLSKITKSELPEWRWSWKQRIFSHDPVGIPEELRIRSVLAEKKKVAFSFVLRNIHLSRNLHASDDPYALAILLLKYDEVRRFLGSSATQPPVEDFPFLLLLAEKKGMLLKDFASELLITTRNSIEILAISEAALLTSIEAIKNASTNEAINTALRQFKELHSSKTRFPR